MKALSTQTAQATEQIGQKIRTVQAATGQATRAIGEIVQAIAALDEIGAGMAGAVSQQSSATQEIAAKLHDAARGAHEVAQRNRGVHEAAERTDAIAGEMLATSRAVSAIADDLGVASQAFLDSARKTV